MRPLPLFIKASNQKVMGLLLAVLACLLYLPSNHFHLFPPQLLPLTAWDRSIPFVPEAVWVYISEYAFFVLAYLACRKPLSWNQYFYSFLFLQTLSVFIFIFWPTTYPRHLFPLPLSTDPATSWIFQALRKTDSPANCCPSLHVGSVYLCSFLFLRENKKQFPFFLTWATLIALSTLPTKQHYLVDLIAGFLLAVLTSWLFHFRLRYQAPSDLS